ncbi:unnamed protein product [Clonostachys chloroleuca]|uniref:Aminotransferase class I/classII large domain-containing protein n=1 Tax=Clonostachys chloroleuca TaxID=1926264 RepID=A0AA35M888_9HYPO|nr:unnamed protein product [Clonostachys chloroleuca]
MNDTTQHINLQLGVLLEKSLAQQALVYGPDPGHPSLRQATAKWLNELYGLDTECCLPEYLFITNGASAGLSYLLSRFTEPSVTRMIWMVEPTYFLACPVFQQAGFHDRLRGVPEDEQGIDIEFLREQIAGVDAQTPKGSPSSDGQKKTLRKVYRHIIYAVPTFSNPSGGTMSLTRRTQLVKLAREVDALIIADDVYDSLRWPNASASAGKKLPPPPLRLVDIDRRLPGQLPWGNAVSNGSFSKIIAPGIRVGWIEGSENTARDLCKLGAVVSGGCQGHFSSMIVGEMLQSGLLQEYIMDTLIPTYQRRSESMLESIKTHLSPLGIRVPSASHDLVPNNSERAVGGFFVYLKLPGDAKSAVDLARLALEKYNLRVATGSMMAVTGDPGSSSRAEVSFGNGLRLCWAWHEESEIDAGIRRLAAAYTELQRG